MRCDAPVLDQPGQVGSRAISRVGYEALGPDAEAVLRPFDHSSLRGHFGLAHRRRRFDIDDYRVIEVNQIVRAVGIKRRLACSRGPARRRVGKVDPLGRNRCRAAERGIVEYLQILAHGASDRFRRQPLLTWHRALKVDISAGEACIHREAFAADQPFGHAALNGHLEQDPQQVAVAEAAVSVFEKVHNRAETWSQIKGVEK